METKNNSYLLDSVVYVSKEKQSYENSLSKESIEVFNTFPYNPSSKASPSTADSWAYSYRNKNFVPKHDVRKNTPLIVHLLTKDVIFCPIISDNMWTEKRCLDV